MEIALVLSVVVMAGAIGVAVWALIGRARAAAQVAAADTARQQAQGERSRLEVQASAMAEEIRRYAEARQELASELARTQAELEAARAAHRSDQETAALRMAEQRQAFEQREREFKEFTAQRDVAMGEKFSSLAADTLARANKELLNLAETKFNAHKAESEAELEKRRAAVEQLVKPIAETLRRTDEKLGAIEKDWTQDRATLVEQMKTIGTAGDALRSETARLVSALREPHVRGRYGEMQLKRVAEISGMSAMCDFTLQHHTVDSDGEALRPDMIVRLPNDRELVVDAKANIQAYLDALNARTPEEAEACMDRFAGHVADQATKLAKKKYWTQYDGSPEFVVMFVPGDGFLDAALSRRPELLESAAQQGVILASPSTLIGLLRAVAVAFKEQRLAAQAQELRELGRELHSRAATAFENIAQLGRTLDKAVGHYNDFIGSYRSRLEPTLRRFETDGAKSSKELPELKSVDTRTRSADEQPMLPAN